MSTGSSDKKTVRVTIFGQSIPIVTSDDPAVVERLAASLDHLLHEIAAKLPSQEPVRIALLACLHLADRLQSLEQDLTQLKQRVDEKSQQFSLLLEQALESRSQD
jgi:cell division protein ZapA